MEKIDIDGTADFSNLSSLRVIIEKTLQAHPLDAHIRILDFLREKGSSEQELEHFKVSWSAVVVGNQAFGMKSRREHVQAESNLFADEFMHQFYKGSIQKRQYDSLFEAISVMKRELADFHISDDFRAREVNAYNQATDCFAELSTIFHKGLENSFKIPDDLCRYTFEDDCDLLSTVAQYQDAFDHVRVVFRKGEHLDNAFKPIESSRLFEYHYRTGKIVFRSQGNQNLPPYLSCDDVVGVDVIYDKTSGQRDSWDTYSFLWDFISCRYFNLFPKPIEVTDSPSPLSQMFVFENPTVEPLSKHLGEDFTRLLLEYPGVLMTWCTQLGAAARAMKVTSGRLYTPLTLTRLLVTDDGNLLFHRLGFMELYEPEQELHQNFEYFTDFIYQVLAALLSCSRDEKVVIPQVAEFRALGYALENPELAFSAEDEQMNALSSEQEHQQPAAVKAAVTFLETLEHVHHAHHEDESHYQHDQQAEQGGEEFEGEEQHAASVHDMYPSFTLTAGSTLGIKLHDLKINHIKMHRYLDIYGPYPQYEVDMTSSFHTLHLIHRCEGIASEEQLPKITATTSDHDNTALITITTLPTSVCVAYLELAVYSPDFKDEALSERRFACIKINIIPAVAAKSVALIELINCMEQYHMHRVKQSTIYSTMLFANAWKTVQDDEKTKEYIETCAIHWSKIKSSMRIKGIQ